MLSMLVSCSSHLHPALLPHRLSAALPWSTEARGPCKAQESVDILVLRSVQIMLAERVPHDR